MTAIIPQETRDKVQGMLDAIQTEQDTKDLVQRKLSEHTIYTALYDAWKHGKCEDYIWNEQNTGTLLFGYTETGDNGIFDLFIQEDNGVECLDTPFSLKIQKEWRQAFEQELKEDEEFTKDDFRTKEMLSDYSRFIYNY